MVRRSATAGTSTPVAGPPASTAAGPAQATPTTPAADLPAEWVRMVLPTAILGLVAEHALHGYGIAQALGERGLGTPRGGSLYPVLGRLERDGLIAAQWRAGDSGPGRKEYTITDRGRERLATDHQSWEALGAMLWAPPTTEEDA